MEASKHLKEASGVTLVHRRKSSELKPVAIALDLHEDADEEDAWAAELALLSADHKATVEQLEALHRQVVAQWRGQHQNNLAVSPAAALSGLVAVVVEDCDAIGHDTLEALVHFLWEYRSTIPVVLVLGVATTAAVFHQGITHATSRRLAMQPVQFEVRAGLGEAEVE